MKEYTSVLIQLSIYTNLFRSVHCCLEQTASLLCHLAHTQGPPAAACRSTQDTDWLWLFGHTHISIRGDGYLEFNNNLFTIAYWNSANSLAIGLHPEFGEASGIDADICSMESRRWWGCRRRVAVRLIGGARGGGGSIGLSWNDNWQQRGEHISKMASDAVIGLQNIAASNRLVHSSGPPPISWWSNRCKIKRLLMNEPAWKEWLPVWTFSSATWRLTKWIFTWYVIMLQDNLSQLEWMSTFRCRIQS